MPVPPMTKYLFLKIANERDSELEACEYLESFAKKCGFLQETIDEMRLALIEALINAKEHAPKGIADNDKDIHVAFTVGPEPDLLTIEVRDFGIGFDPGTVEIPDIKKKLKSSHKRGWGLMLMEKLMDGCEVTSFPPSGTLIKLVKKRLQPNQADSEDIVRERKRIERLTYILGSFLDLSSFLCQNRDLETGLRSMLRIMLGTLGISRGSIFIYDQANEEMISMVDIRLRTRERLPKFKLPVQALQKFLQQDSLDVTQQILSLNPDISGIFSKDEVASCYLLRIDNEVLGLLMLGNNFGNAEKEPYDADLMTTLARNISTAINTFKLLDRLKATNQELDRNVRELGAVREASQAVLSELDLENLPFTVERIFAEVMKIGKFSLSVFDPTENKYFIYQTNRSLPPVLDINASPILKYVLEKREPLFVPDITKEDRFAFVRADAYSSKSFIAIPIIVQNEVLGALCLTDRTDGQELTERDFHLARLLCTQVGIAVKNANLYKLGVSDSLSNLYSPHYFKMRLAQEIARARRLKSNLSLIVFEIENLKHLKEQFGDTLYNDLLSQIGSSIRRHIRFNDVACRIGESRFAVILSDTAVDGAAAVVEKLKNTVSGDKFTSGLVQAELKSHFSSLAYAQNMTPEQFFDAAEQSLEALGKAITGS